LVWVMRDVGMDVTRGLEARVQGHGKLQGAWDGMSLDGDIEVVNALYDRNLGVGDLLDWLRQQFLPKGGATARERAVLRLNLLVYSHGGVFIDNDFVKSELWLNLQLSGDVNRPSVAGNIGILSGEVAFRGRQFTVTGGTLDFRDPYRVNPVLNIA